MEQPMTGAIPTPPDFPVSWERPEDAMLFWTHDTMHFPDPLTPMDDGLLKTIFVSGFNGSGEKYDIPIRVRINCINSYYYSSFAPATTAPEELEAMGQRAQEKIGAVLGHIGDYWGSELLPEVKENLAYWRSFDLQGVSMPQLVAHLDDTVARASRMWQIHFAIAFPFLMGMGLFDDFYRDLLGNESAFDAYRLLQGFDNTSLQAGRALWRLSREARQQPEVHRVLEERATDEVVPALEKSVAGRAFLVELQAYLNEYGQHSDLFSYWSSPSWIENPSPVIKNLKDYISQPDRDDEAELAAKAAEREELLVQVRARLQGYPKAVVGQFEFLLKAAQESTVLSEDHNYWIDQRCTYQVRRVLMEFGRRLAAAGAIAQAEDVFYLTPAELSETALSSPVMNRHTVVMQRQQEVARARAIKPPPVLGTMPPGPPPDDPMTRTLGKFFGGPPQEPSTPGTLRGNAGSPGLARGPAKVIRSLAEASKLQQGDILVSETTAPPWTPLFATAAAVVTDTGGILSHCAVVAREYHIPAVVGVGIATAVIQDGQMLEVNGDTGEVRIIPSPN
ncbi:MAG: hypothetical protein EXR62_08060 [Chloroflexi bacterium]|nr:hypothetical protein [Chloroflexota bacterium]